MSLTEKWFNLLSQGNVDKMLDIAELKFDTDSSILAIMEYRRLEMQRGRGQSYNNKVTRENIIGVLEELFLEPCSHYKQMLHNRMEKLKLDVRQMYSLLYGLHLENTGLRFATILKEL